jgi:hypothetical protein
VFPEVIGRCPGSRAQNRTGAASSGTVDDHGEAVNLGSSRHPPSEKYGTTHYLSVSATLPAAMPRLDAPPHFVRNLRFRPSRGISDRRPPPCDGAGDRRRVTFRDDHDHHDLVGTGIPQGGGMVEFRRVGGGASRAAWSEAVRRRQTNSGGRRRSRRPVVMRLLSVGGEPRLPDRRAGEQPGERRARVYCAVR